MNISFLVSIIGILYVIKYFLAVQPVASLMFFSLCKSMMTLSELTFSKIP